MSLLSDLSPAKMFNLRGYSIVILYMQFWDKFKIRSKYKIEIFYFSTQHSPSFVGLLSWDLMFKRSEYLLHQIYGQGKETHRSFLNSPNSAGYSNKKI